MRAQAQCSSIDFAASYNSGCLPTLVKFTATGVPAGSTLYWDFGNGNVSGSTFMFETFYNPGTYDVKLEVTLPNGTVCTKTKNALFTFTSVPEPTFFASDTMICSKPAQVTLTDSTPNVSRREWYIDGSLLADTSNIISYTFASPGYKSVTLKVFDVNGCSKVLARNNYINVKPSYDIYFCSKMTEDVSRSSITAHFTPYIDPKAISVVAYEWEFPGGTPSSYNGKNPPNVVYNDLSTPQDVTFTIRTADGCVARFTKSNLIRKYYSVPANNYCEVQVAPLTIPKFADYTVKNISGSKKLTYRAGRNDIYNITFKEAGDFDIKVAFNYTGAACSDTLILKQLYNVGSGRADVVVDDPTHCELPATVTFSSLYSRPSIGFNTYKWEITDTLKQHVAGSPFAETTDTSLSYTFYDEGIFTVKLTVMNSAGCTTSVTKAAAVRIGMPVIDVFFPVTQMCAGDRWKPSNYSSPKTGSAAFIHNWTLTNRDTAITLTAKIRNPTFTMRVPGTYDVMYSIGNGPDSSCLSIEKYPAALTVNGVMADFKSVLRAGCLPFTTTLEPVIKVSKPDTATLSYTWRAIPSEGVVFTDSNAVSPSVSFPKNGCYTIVMIVKSSAGCSATVTKKNFICVGTIAEFTIQDDGCKDQEIVVKNTSKLSPNTFRWEVTPSANVIITPNATAKVPTFRFTKDGCYQIKLVTGKKIDKRCDDSTVRTICIKAPVARFETEDTVKTCAPVLVQFTSKSMNADTFIWDFGDGNILKTTDTTPVHTYETNNPDGFTVKLTAIRKYGCRDSFTIKNYVKVFGPVPSFKTDKNKTCGDLFVNFTNTSKYVKHFYMAYGDNSPIDSNKVAPHQYNFYDYDLDSNVFYPTMYAIDTTGCLSIFKSKIVLYRPPAVDFTVATPTVCTGQPIQFVNNTKYADTYEWDFNNDGIVDDTNRNPVYVFNQTGWRTITLTARTKSGCKVTLKKDSTFFVYEKPTSKFTVSQKIACATDTIYFTYAGASDVPVVRYHWEFNDGTLLNDTANTRNAFYRYKNPGDHRVRLTIYNQNGCSDTFSMLINSPDTTPPVKPEIYYVTVTAQNSIQIVYNKAVDTTDFGKYHVYQTGVGPATEISNSANINDTIATSTLVNTSARSYCFTTKVEDVCGLISQPSTAHCSIHLDVTENNGVSNKVSWTPYQGWINVQAYEVYRKEDGGSYSLHKTFNGTVTNFIDSNLCDKMYGYYVRALHPNGVHSSLSNHDSLRPPYVYQGSPLEMYSTTVVNDAFTYTSWKPSEQLNVKTYVVDKYTEGMGWQPAYRLTKDNFITDNEVDVQNTSYKYVVRVIDDCGNISPLSNPANSIVLQTEVKDDKRFLSWNKYRKWDAGVQEYLVQLRDNNNTFRTIAWVSATDSHYVDDSSHAYINGPTCYRVVAVENAPGSLQDSSASNTRCAILPARIYVPNVFTPNGDGHNEIFKVEGLSVIENPANAEQQFTFRIFNRWGQLIFETHDIDTGWDGKFNGEAAPVGTYMYSVEARGLEGSRIYLNGSFNLMK